MEELNSTMSQIKTTVGSMEETLLASNLTNVNGTSKMDDLDGKVTSLDAKIERINQELISKIETGDAILKSKLNHQIVEMKLMNQNFKGMLDKYNKCCIKN
jgi:hypothetical protein